MIPKFPYNFALNDFLVLRIKANFIYLLELIFVIKIRAKNGGRGSPILNF